MKALPITDLPELRSVLVFEDHARDSQLLLLDDSLDEAQPLPPVHSASQQARHVAVLIRLESKGSMQRLLQFIGLPFRVRRATRSLRELGFENSERFAVTPDIRQPVIVYSLRSAAAQYAQDCFLPAHRGAAGKLRSLISRWAGCDLSVGAVLIVGRAS